MNWTSPAAFFAMGGYGVYVWGSVAACALALACELALLRARRAAIVRVIRRRSVAAPAAMRMTERTA